MSQLYSVRVMRVECFGRRQTKCRISAAKVPQKCYKSVASNAAEMRRKCGIYAALLRQSGRG